MTTPEARSHLGAVATIGRILAVLVTVVAGIIFVLTAWVAVGSRFGPPDRDVHGYGLIFGTVMAILAGFIVAAILPLALPRRRRRAMYAISMAAFGVVFVLLVASLVTA